MKIQCPSCRTEYEVDNSYLDQEVECPKCNETFTVSMSMLIVDSTTNTAKDKKIEIPKPSNCVYSSEGNPSKEGEESLTNGNSSSKGYSKYLIFGIAILLLGVFVFAASSIFKSAKSKAIENCMTMYEVESVDFKILDSKTVKKAWKERARLQYELAEKNGLGDEFIKFWNDRKVIGFVKKMVDLSRNKDKRTPEMEKEMAETTKFLEVNYPKYKKIFELYDSIEKEYKSVHQLMIGYGCMRSLTLLAMDEKYKNVGYDELKSKTINFFADVLYTSWNKSSEIAFPASAHKLCVNEAKQLIEIIEAESKDLARDWMLIILSPIFENEVKMSKARDGETIHALYWLELHGEKMLSKLPYGTSMDDFLEIKHDSWHFYGRYQDTCNYGRIER